MGWRRHRGGGHSVSRAVNRTWWWRRIEPGKKVEVAHRSEVGNVNQFDQWARSLKNPFEKRNPGTTAILLKGAGDGSQIAWAGKGIRR